jgi:hypothetical protein
MKTSAESVAVAATWLRTRCKRAQTEWILPLIMIRSLELAAAPVETCRPGTRQPICTHRICQQEAKIAKYVFKRANY